MKNDLASDPFLEAMTRQTKIENREFTGRSRIVPDSISGGLSLGGLRGREFLIIFWRMIEITFSKRVKKLLCFGVLASSFALSITGIDAQAKGLDFTWEKDKEIGGEHLRIDGEIEPGDFERFLRFIRIDQHRYLESANQNVRLNSRGGSFIEAIRISQLLKKLYPKMTVGREDICASSCFFLFLSGAERNVWLGGRIGIHRVYFDGKFYAGLSTSEARKRESDLYLLVEEILKENRVPQYLREAMNSVPSNEIRWLDDIEIKNLGQMPPWYEEYLIAKCNYGDVRTMENDFLGGRSEDLPSGSQVKEYVMCRLKLETEEIQKVFSQKERNDRPGNLPPILTSFKTSLDKLGKRESTIFKNGETLYANAKITKAIGRTTTKIYLKNESERRISGTEVNIDLPANGTASYTLPVPPNVPSGKFTIIAEVFDYSGEKIETKSIVVTIENKSNEKLD